MNAVECSGGSTAGEKKKRRKLSAEPIPRGKKGGGKGGGGLPPRLRSGLEGKRKRVYLLRMPERRERKRKRPNHTFLISFGIGFRGKKLQRFILNIRPKGWP